MHARRRRTRLLLAAEVSVSLAALEAVRTYGTLKNGCFVPHDCEGRPVLEGDNNGKQPKGGEDGEDEDDAAGAQRSLL